MDLAASCRDKLARLRIKELKDVLTQLGLSKQGKKQDLVDRILPLLGDDQVPKPAWGRKDSMGREGVAKIIDDAYRKMQIPGATDLASKSHSGSEFSYVKSKEELVSHKPDTKVRCFCGKSLNSESMIQCEDTQCRIWQHIDCVIIPEKPGESTPEVPSPYYCEICRINRADPFWATIKHPLFPVKLSSCGLAVDGWTILQNAESGFQLSRSARELLQRPDYDLQVWCLLLNDKVPFRMHWPQLTELQVNGVSVRVATRPPSQLLGINGRDDGPVISTWSMEGINKIVLSRVDARIFCFGIRIAKRRTVPQVLGLVPNETEGEQFQEALARVCRCIDGGAATENADSDSDIELVADSVTVNLRCPMSGSRIRIAGRSKPCVHLKCFDLEAFIELNHRSQKWQCPICLKNYSLENIVIDPYFNRITSMLQSCGEDVAEIDVKSNGSWRVKSEVEFRELSKWHMPNGTLSDILEDIKPDMQDLGYMHQKSPSERQLGLNFAMSRVPSAGNPILTLENHSHNIINMSSSATGSYRDAEDHSVNQEFCGPFDLSLNNGHEFDSFNILDRTYSVEDRPPALLKEPDIICLSDSDEENFKLISPETANKIHAVGDNMAPFITHRDNMVPLLTHPVGSERISDKPGPETSGTSFLELFNTDDFEMSIPMPIWPMQTCPQQASGFQLFGIGVPDVLVDAHNSLSCPPINGYGLTPNNGGENTSQLRDFSNCHPGDAIEECLVSNPVEFPNDDPSLQIFLPDQPVGSLQDDMINRPDIPNVMNSDDWISLRLTAGDVQYDSAPLNGLSSRQPEAPKESQMDLLGDAASLLLSANSLESNKPTPGNQISDCSPVQPRTVRRWLYLSIDTDSD